MPIPSLSDLFQDGVDILTTTVSSTVKRITAQIGSVIGEGQTDSDNADWWQHVGFASRPSKAVPGKEAAQAFVVRRGNFDAVIASQDVRGLALYGNLAEGETCIYAGGEDGNAQARILLKADGSINLFTKGGNTSDGSGMGVFINPSGAISIAGSEGNALMLEDDGSVLVFNGSGALQIKADGSIKIAGAKVEMSGGSITLGGATALQLALAPHVVSALTNLQTQITALATGLVTVGAAAAVAPGASGAGPAAVAAQAQVTQTAALLGALMNLIPTKRVAGD